MSAHWHISSRQCAICEKIIVNIWHIAKHCVSLHSQTRKDDHSLHGEMAEWSNAPVLKTGVLQGTGGSNPSLSAVESCKSKDLQDFFLFVLLSSPPLGAPDKLLGSVRKLGCKRQTYAHSFVNLKRKKGISATPLNWLLNAFTLALNDSAPALVCLFTK